MKKKFTSLLIAGIASLAIGTSLTGCSSSKLLATPAPAHIVHAGGVGTKAGLGQNPLTGAYELNIGRIQLDFTTVPIQVTTNRDGEQHFIAPDFAASWESTGHSAVFGNAATTMTIGTGTNAVKTTLVGGHYPINQNFGTGAQTPTALPGPASWAPAPGTPIVNPNPGQAP